MQVTMRKVSDVKPYDKNPRRNDGAVDAVAASIREFGFQQPLVVDKDGVLIVGHTRLKAAKKLGMKEVPVVVADGLSPEQVKAYRLADNKTGELAEWEMGLLEEELADLCNFDMEQFGFETQEPDEDICGKYAGARTGVLAQKYLFAPFSVLDGRSGKWMERKRQWGELLQADSREGRKTGLLGSGLEALGKAVGSSLTGTSEFDPVLCELLIRWFCPVGGRVVDPFAGGHVRGTVSMALACKYSGVDIRQEQIEANYDALDSIRIAESEIYAEENRPVWHCGDSKNIRTIIGEDNQFDFLLMCPPYGDLERYSDDPADISTMDYADFLVAYREIIKETVQLLRQDAYAAVVISDIRDKKGLYRGFYSDTVQAFADAGMALYNDMVKIDNIGTGAIRAGKQFEAGRKVVRTHQNVLVFVKGNPKNINCGEYNFDFSTIETEEAYDDEY